MSSIENMLESRRKKAKKGCITPYDAYSSVPGERMHLPYWPASVITGGGLGTPASAAAAASMCAAQASMAGGDGGGVAVGGGEADDRKVPAGLTIVANTVDGMAKSKPNSDVVKEIKNLFDRLRAEPASFQEPFYQSGDGADADPNGDTVSCLAAACEATLGAFKRATGIDYEEFRQKT